MWTPAIPQAPRTLPLRGCPDVLLLPVHELGNLRSVKFNDRGIQTLYFAIHDQYRAAIAVHAPDPVVVTQHLEDRGNAFDLEVAQRRRRRGEACPLGQVPGIKAEQHDAAPELPGRANRVELWLGPEFGPGNDEQTVTLPREGDEFGRERGVEHSLNRLYFRITRRLRGNRLEGSLVKRAEGGPYLFVELFYRSHRASGASRQVRPGRGKPLFYHANASRRNVVATTYCQYRRGWIENANLKPADNGADLEAGPAGLS